MVMFHTIRLVAMVTVSVFALIVLALAADLVSIFEVDFDEYPAGGALAIAIALLTLLTVPAMIILDFVRRGAFTSFIIVEVGWLGVLAILWLATAADTSSNAFGDCAFFGFYADNLVTACHEWNAIQAFSHLNWIILLIYTAFIIVMTLMAHNRGNFLWKSSVRDADFNAVGTGAADQEKGHQYPQQQGIPQQQYPQQTGTPLNGQEYPPQQTGAPVQQQQYPPQQGVPPQHAQQQYPQV